MTHTSGEKVLTPRSYSDLDRMTEDGSVIRPTSIHSHRQGYARIYIRTVLQTC